MSTSSISQPTVTAIVITYNSAEHVAEAVTSLESALDHLGAEILVVDNASADDTVDVAGAHLKRGRVIANADNLGYARAANVGIRQARGQMTLVMNDDARLGQEDINRLIAVLSSSDRIALVGPRIVDANGKPTHSARNTFPGPQEEWQRLKDIFSGRDKNAYDPDAPPTPVHWLIAACVLGKTSVLRQVGGFNEEFFLYGEDIDLGRRLMELGFQSVTVPDAVCVHVGEVSTSKTYTADERMVRQVKGRSVYYRLWLPRWLRSLVYLRRALGFRLQPARLKMFGPMIIWDGPSLKNERFPAPLASGPQASDDVYSAPDTKQDG